MISGGNRYLLLIMSAEYTWNLTRFRAADITGIHPGTGRMISRNPDMVGVD